MLKQGPHLAQRAVTHLRERDAVVRVALSLRHAADLCLKALGDRQAGGVVGRIIDAQAGGKLLQVLREIQLIGGQVLLHINRGDVRVDDE